MNKNIELNITEIFYSLQGEAQTVGIPTIFIRLTGCPLRCVYCDTEYAFKGQNLMRIDEIIKEIKQYNTSYICVTGGEPLAQKNCLILLDELVKNYNVSLETSGSIDISPVNKKVAIVMDIKTPSSGEMDKNLWANLSHLQTQHQVKFVMSDKADFDWSVNIIKEHNIEAQILFSPIADKLKPTQLADWILEKQLNVRMQIQLHKLLWDDKQGK
jgi:7-carboxy-7-deazaguanine synthase